MAKDKKEDIQKNGVDYLIEQGYKKISTKTFISDVDLEKFLNRDFDGINKARALGFIQILQREYDVDLSDLKSAYLDHELSHRVKAPETLFVEKPMRNRNEWQKYLQYIGSILLIGGLLYMFVDFINEGTDSSENLTERVEENKSTIDEVQKNLERFEENRTSILTLINKTETEQNISLPILMDEDNDSDDLDLDKVVLKMMQDRNITVDDNSSNEKVEIPVDTSTQTLTPKKIKPTLKVEKMEPKKKETIKGNLYIEPSKRAWVGIIYLDNYKKKDYLIRTKLPLDSSRDQIVVIGHSFFKIYNKKYSVNFAGSGPVRFVYRDGELMEINKKEFKRLSAGVSW